MKKFMIMLLVASLGITACTFTGCTKKYSEGVKGGSGGNGGTPV